MNRRDWIKATIGGQAVAPAVMTNARLLSASSASVETRIVRLKLRHTWTTTMSSSGYRDTLHVCYQRDGVAGRGEGAPIVRYHETAESARKALESIRDFLTSINPWQFEKALAEIFSRIEGQYAAPLVSPFDVVVTHRIAEN